MWTYFPLAFSNYTLAALGFWMYHTVEDLCINSLGVPATERPTAKCRKVAVGDHQDKYGRGGSTTA